MSRTVPVVSGNTVTITVTDGGAGDSDLVLRALANGVELLALTDHDEIGGQARAREAALDLGLAWLSGTEISVSFAGETVQFERLGYFCADIDSTPGSPVFNRTLTLKDSWARLQAQGRHDSA